MIDTCESVYFDIPLNECPFCGKPARFVRRIVGVKYSENISISVECINCAASIMPIYMNDLPIRYPDKCKPMFPDIYEPITEFMAAQKAADEWNRRI